MARKMQDTIFNLYAFSITKRLGYIKESLYYYRRNQNASTVGYRPDFSDIMFQILIEIKKFNLDKGEPLTNGVIHAKTIMLFIEMMTLQYVHGKCKTKYSKKLADIKMEYNIFT